MLLVVCNGASHENFSLSLSCNFLLLSLVVCLYGASLLWACTLSVSLVTYNRILHYHYYYAATIAIITTSTTIMPKIVR